MAGPARHVHPDGEVSLPARDDLAFQPAGLQHEGKGARPGLLFDEGPGMGRPDLLVGVEDEGDREALQQTRAIQGLHGKYPHHEPAFHVDDPRPIGMPVVLPVPVKGGILRKHGIHVAGHEDLRRPRPPCGGADHQVVAAGLLGDDLAPDTVPAEFRLDPPGHPVDARLVTGPALDPDQFGKQREHVGFCAVHMLQNGLAGDHRAFPKAESAAPKAKSAA